MMKRMIVLFVWSSVLIAVPFCTLISSAYGIENAASRYEQDLFKEGRALMIGETLIKPLKIDAIPIPARISVDLTSQTAVFDTGRALMQASQWKPYTLQDFGIDMSRVTSGPLERRTLGELGMNAVRLPFGLMGGAGSMGVIVFDLINIGLTLRDISRFGQGIANVEILRYTVPHVAIPIEIMRGPENAQWQRTTENFNRSFNDGKWDIQQSGTKITDRTFVSSAPGYIGRYGYDPKTDRINTNVRIQTNETMQREGGRQDFNTFQNQSIPSYSPPSRIESFSSRPTISVPSYSPPPRMPSFGGRR